jgi:exodeoxyribonuclease VII small subunit
LKTTKNPETFEHELARLSEIVDALEKGDVPLDGSLALFEEGVKLARAAQDRLDRAQKRIEELVAVNADGTARTVPFDP